MYYSQYTNLIAVPLIPSILFKYYLQYSLRSTAKDSETLHVPFAVHESNIHYYTGRALTPASKIKFNTKYSKLLGRTDTAAYGKLILPLFK